METLVKTTKAVYLTLEEFDSHLETCLLILDEPSPSRPYYVCEFRLHRLKQSSAALDKTIVHVYIKRQ